MQIKCYPSGIGNFQWARCRIILSAASEIDDGIIRRASHLASFSGLSRVIDQAGASVSQHWPNVSNLPHNGVNTLLLHKYISREKWRVYPLSIFGTRGLTWTRPYDQLYPIHAIYGC